MPMNYCMSLLAPGDSIIAFAPLSERKMHRPEALVQIAQGLGAQGYVVDSYAEAVARRSRNIGKHGCFMHPI
jgi:hypothetical protein